MLTVRQVWRSTLAVTLITAGMTGVVAGQYHSTFGDALNGSALRALAANPAIQVLFGEPVALDSAGGFTVWRTGTPIAVLVGMWALLMTTRITRGEEDTGRWALLLAGRLRRHDVVVRCLAVVAVGVIVVGLAMDLTLVLTGTHPTGAMLHAAGIVGLGLTFATLGAFAAQVFPTRSGATGLSTSVLGAALLLRMFADGVNELAWLRWITPFGLVAETQPYAANRPGPLLVLAVFPLLFAGAARLATTRRDLGAGLVVHTSGHRPRTWLLRWSITFSVRRALRPFTGWALGIATYYAFIGALTTSITNFLAENVRFAQLAAAAGFPGMGSASGFAATMFSLLALPTGIYAATRIATIAADETNRRAVMLFALPLPRSRLSMYEAVVAAAGVFALLIGAGIATWVGTVFAGTQLGIGAALSGALNVAPIALLSLGAAVLALGWAPRAVAAIGALPTAGGFLLDVLARSTGAPEWISQLSPFTHLAAVPATAPDWTATTGILITAVVLATLGVLGYARRDLAC